jgi:hypothetical protein
MTARTVHLKCKLCYLSYVCTGGGGTLWARPKEKSGTFRLAGTADGPTACTTRYSGWRDIAWALRRSGALGFAPGSRSARTARSSEPSDPVDEAQL